VGQHANDPRGEKLLTKCEVAQLCRVEIRTVDRWVAAGKITCYRTPGGRLLLEHGQGQDGPVREILQRAGLEEVGTWPDLAGIPRVSGGKVE